MQGYKKQSPQPLSFSSIKFLDMVAPKIYFVNRIFTSGRLIYFPAYGILYAEF